MARKKKPSFGKILGIFAGSMLALAIVVFLVITMMTKKSTEVTSRKAVTSQQSQASTQTSYKSMAEVDVMEQRLRLDREEAVAAAKGMQAEIDLLKERLRGNTEYLQKQNAFIMQLKGELDALKSANSRTMITKKRSNARYARKKHRPVILDQKALEQGYHIQAEVDGRTWIQTPDGRTVTVSQ